MLAKTKLSPKDAAALSEFVRGVRTALGDQALDLRLFGSKVTGRDTAESDIDVLVVVKDSDPAIEDRILDIAFEVNLEHDVYVSPCVVPKGVLEHPVWKITPFLESVVRRGIPL